MDWFWDILKIEPTEEIPPIKKAYVERVREYKQLETKGQLPEHAYEELEKAEKAALAYVEKQLDKTLSYNRAVHSEPMVRFKRPVTKVEGTESIEVSLKTEKTSAKKELEKSENVDQKIDLIDQIEPVELPELDSATKEEKIVVERQPKSVKKETIVVKEKKVDDTFYIHDTLNEKKHVLERFKRNLNELFSDWDMYTDLDHWESAFIEKELWDSTVLGEIRLLTVEKLSKNAIFMPKRLVKTINEELKLALSGSPIVRKWLEESAKEPSFEIMKIGKALLPKEREEYLLKRHQIYNELSFPPKKINRQKIDRLIAEVKKYASAFNEKIWQMDEDFKNLLIIYIIKRNPQQLLSDSNEFDDVTTLLADQAQSVSEIRNHTKRFLANVYAAISQKDLAMEEIVFIENMENTYIDEELTFYLLSVVFYHTGDVVKVEKYRNQLMHYPIKSGSKSGQAKTGKRTVQKTATSQTYKKKSGMTSLFRILIIGSFYFLIFGNGLDIVQDFFSDRFQEDVINQGYFDDSDYDETSDDYIHLEDSTLPYLFVDNIMLSSYEGKTDDDVQEYLDQYVSQDAHEKIFNYYQENNYEQSNSDLVPYEFSFIGNSLNSQDFIVISKEEENIAVLLLNEAGKISHVYGEFWENNPEIFNQYIAAKDIENDQSMSKMFEVLSSEDSEIAYEKLLTYSAFFTDTGLWNLALVIDEEDLSEVANSRYYIGESYEIYQDVAIVNDVNDTQLVVILEDSRVSLVDVYYDTAESVLDNQGNDFEKEGVVSDYLK